MTTNKKVFFFLLFFLLAIPTTGYAANENECEKQGGSCNNKSYCIKNCTDGCKNGIEINIGDALCPGQLNYACCKKKDGGGDKEITSIQCEAKNADGGLYDGYGHCTTTGPFGGSNCSETQTKKGVCSDKRIGTDCCVDDSAPPTSNSDTPTSLNYTLLEKIPGIESATSNLKSYIEALYNIALGLIVLSAVFMLVIGGFMYLTSAGNTSQIGSAKTVITDAIIGLVIALVAVLVLYVINPDLIHVTLNGLSLTPQSGSSAPPPTAGSGDVYTNDQAVAALSAAGISVSSTNSCSDPAIKGCTSLESIPKSTIDNIIKLKQTSGCSFRVTGGTETGHVSHGAGRPIVDVSREQCLASYFLSNKASGTLTSATKITKICANSADQNIAFNCSYVEPAAHFHLVFST